MTQEQLKNKVKNTMLMPKEMKDRLLSVEWDDDLLNTVQAYFNKYGAAEDEVITYINANGHKMIINYIHELEQSERKDLVFRLEELKKLIMFYRRDI